MFHSSRILSSLFSEKCVALNFINNFGSPFKLYSSLKHVAYLVTESGFKLKLMIDRPELHSQVTFHAEDPDGQRKLLLNGKESILEPVVSGCPEFKDITVISEQGILNKWLKHRLAKISYPLKSWE